MFKYSMKSLYLRQGANGRRQCYILWIGKVHTKIMAKSKFVSIQPFPYFPQKLNFETTMSTYRHVVDGVWIARVYCCPCSAWKWASNGVRILWVPRTRPCCHTMETAGQTDSGVNSWVVHFFITFSLHFSLLL